MQLFRLLTEFAENSHHQLCIEELLNEQKLLIKEANTNSEIRNILSKGNNCYPDRDKVVKIE